jgi:hypothetical protein
MMIAIKLRLDQIDKSKIRQSDGCDDDDFCDADNDDVGIDAGIDTAPSRRPPCDMASAYLSERARAAGVVITIETKDVVIPSIPKPTPVRLAFCKGPDGEIIEPTKGDKRYVRRNAKGELNKVVDVGKSLSSDKRTTTKKKVPKGQGDRGDRAK